MRQTGTIRWLVVLILLGLALTTAATMTGSDGAGIRMDAASKGQVVQRMLSYTADARCAEPDTGGHRSVTDLSLLVPDCWLVHDAQGDPRYLPIPGADDICAAIGIPVIVGNQLLGVLNVESSELLDEDDVALLEVAGNQLGGPSSTLASSPLKGAEPHARQPSTASAN